jgi:hypothetical protein
MHPSIPAFIASFLVAITFPAALRAQTFEVQTKVEAKLWVHRWLDRAGSPEGLATIGVFVAITVGLLLAVAWRRRAARRKTEGKRVGE